MFCYKKAIFKIYFVMCGMPGLNVAGTAFRLIFYYLSRLHCLTVTLCTGVRHCTQLMGSNKLQCKVKSC